VQGSYTTLKVKSKIRDREWGMENVAGSSQHELLQKGRKSDHSPAASLAAWNTDFPAGLT
jgi:hypothetical protein